MDYVFSHKEYSEIEVSCRCILIAEPSKVIRYLLIKQKLDCQAQ